MSSGAGRALSGASQAQLAPLVVPAAAKRPARAHGESAREPDRRTAPAAAGAFTRLPLEQKSLLEEGSKCRHLPFGIVRARHGDEVAAMSCKQWRCDDCRPMLRKRLRKAFVAATEANPDLRRFFTLTMPGTTRQLDLEQRYVAISAAFQRFRQKMAKLQGRTFPYALVREPHRDGTPHIHGLTDRFIPRKQLQRLWGESGGGVVGVDIKLVDPHRAAAYVSKYLVKDNATMLPKGMRKYASGGGVKLWGVRPRGDGSWFVELHSQGRWAPVSEMSLVYAHLAWLRQQERVPIGWLKPPPRVALAGCGCSGGMACRRCR